MFHNGAPLLDGLFGVPKGSVLDDGLSLSTCPLRAVSNAIPSNSVQFPIAGEIADMPLHTLWHSWELTAVECALWSADDQSSAFYLFKLPEAWRPCFVIGKKRTVAIAGVDSRKIWTAVAVIPMGWLSTCAVFQHVSGLGRLASGAARSTDILHTAGSPCPGFCAWNVATSLSMTRAPDSFVKRCG